MAYRATKDQSILMQGQATFSTPYEQQQPLDALDSLVGQSPVFQELREQARLAAHADCRVLLIGEKGSGKEALAQAIHRSSRRREQPFHKIRCAEFHPCASQHPFQVWDETDSLISHNAVNRPIELFSGGTLYLHEVGTLTSEAQTWLLRCLLILEMDSVNQRTQDAGDQIRIIAGTSRDLRDDVASHRFRPDLFYRLNIVPLYLPPLRERLDDIEDLAHHCLRKYAGKYGKTIKGISEKTVQVFSEYSWPGNIEEMESLIERGIILSRGDVLHIDQISLGPTNFPLHS